MTDKHLRWGFPKCFNRIRKLGYKWNHKRVYRVYCELKLNLRVKRKQHIPPRSPEKITTIQCSELRALKTTQGYSYPNSP
ncbi:IS3 family transposase [Snodgrassella sp. ESL0253]|uniref:IS3 family transposase n=1 Tax=Snodgrassella sp. ESL0253 TaxID=2705031 RepID=UPI00351B3981